MLEVSFLEVKYLKYLQLMVSENQTFPPVMKQNYYNSSSCSAVCCDNSNAILRRQPKQLNVYLKEGSVNLIVMKIVIFVCTHLFIFF